jgi:cytochrome b561
MSATLSEAPRAELPAARSRYSSVAIALHWTIAALFLTNIALAWYLLTLGPAALGSTQIMWHKSIGITVLLLSFARLGWRIIHPAPTLPPYMRGWERFAAQTVHALFYVLMIGMPLSGWAWVSSSPLLKIHPTVLYGVIPWPAFPLSGLGPDQMHAARKTFQLTHESLAWVAYGAIFLHVGAALKHQFIDRDGVVGRMAPFLAPKRP